ncbi:exopolysaccharide biosynthesis protein [Pedobacter sp. AK017]|uniref:phosphodiester glycosidase family protein n=1 Tax=Pedobacter sp. AK017 TaxID=2723073 RepID=UPI00161E10BD|nr:phosphodiester glycosidase family protein [Pedobacter sp. AK017]MBB5438941.1 exopolysaccharide biosynthesis protein [Pedobacter sp. AK017]
MKKKLIHIILSWLIICSSCSIKKNQTADEKLFAKGTWTSAQLGPGVVYTKYYTENLFGDKQRLHIITIKSLRTLNLAIGWSADSLKKTSTFAKSAQADFAINGSFFHPEEGGPVCFLKVDGKIIRQTREELGEDYFIKGLDSGALIKTRKGKWKLAVKPQGGWNTLQSTPTILSGGPVLINNNQIISQLKHSFSLKRFSRTAIGITASHQFIFLVADGNSPSSAGLSIAELAVVMKSLHCTDALNLDGGGSSSMYINGKPQNGIVNQPTDYHYYDFRSERKVATVLMGQFR